MKKKKEIIIVLIIIVLGIILYLLFNNNSIINNAKKYIEKNNIDIKELYYLPINKLNNDKYLSCNNASGIIIEDNEYHLYTKCGNDESNIFSNENEYIKLIGKSIIVLNLNEPYIELGYSLKNSSIKVNVENNLKKESGIYTVKYYIYQNNSIISTLKRYVIITDNKNINIDGKKNDDYPNIRLKGNNPMNVEYLSSYVEPGYFAFGKDNIIIKNVKVSGEVNTNILGTYDIFYTAIDNDNDMTTVKRNVNVVKANVNLQIDVIQDEKVTNDKTLVNLIINGEGFSYVILPNGEKESKNNFSYEFDSNGIYQFKIYDINGDEFIKEINIKNIDKEAPNGTCTVTIDNKNANFVVKATDNNNIKNYQYIIGNNSVTNNNSNYVHSGAYKKYNVPNLKVKIIDEAENSKEINCTINNQIKPEIYKDINGNTCLEPYICYKQIDYNDPYQATSNGVGTIYSSGCLPVSMTIISTLYDKRSSNGNLYTPPVLIKELIYPDGKIVGYSNYTRVKEIASKLNLKVSQQYDMKKDIEIFKNHLKTGNPIIINSSRSCYTTGAHYLAVLGINDEGKVFLTDPYVRSNKSMTGKCAVNTWVDLSEMVSKGGITYFALINE